MPPAFLIATGRLPRLVIPSRFSPLKLFLYLFAVALGVSFLYQRIEWPWVTFRKAEAAFAHEKYNDAAVLYERAAGKLDDPRVLRGLAECWLAVGRLTEAEAVLVRSLKTHPDQLPAINLLAGIYQKAQQPQKAIALFTQYLARAKTLDPLSNLLLARAYRQAALYNDAAVFYLQAAKDPGLKTITDLELAEMQSWQGRYDEATALFRQVLIADPSNSQARLGLARVLSWTGHYKESEDEYRKLLNKP
jgi:tetratricopeptide (TPR) repeat protein